ncbi:MAG: hypothetical protein K6E33_03355, partial [Lachnospiraceae bacterium]|nr:hypothetical protein [Lachnospiraceae bacterium]
WYGYCIVYGGAEIPGRSSTSCNPQNKYTTWTYKVSYTTNGNLSDSWGMTDNVNELKLWTTKNKDHEIGDNNAFSRITEGSLKRRVFNNNLNLRIHTANDGESRDGDVITAPANGAALKKDSGVYASMKPEVVIDNGNGGVNGDGRIYVGSKLKFSLKYTDSYKPYSGSALNTAVYMTRSDGSIVNARIEPGTNGVYYVTMLWDGMEEADLNDTYTINAVMTRSQEIELNLRPSVPRKTDDKGNITSEIDTDKVGEAWNDFWRSGSDYITLGVSEAMKDAPHFGSKNITEIKIPKTDWASGDKNPLKNLGTYENVQYINFNRSKNDVIAVNGNQYNGNDKIYLSVSDLAFAKVSFSYYKKEYLSMPSIMEASISRVEIYLDGNGDGKINGSYNANTGYFVLDEGTEDTFEFYMEEGGSYDESMFQPVELEGGKYGQYFSKIFYTMTPRYLEKPVDAKDSDAAQVLPAFTTSRTEEEMISRLTEEQNSYRYIMPGTDKDGKRTSDGHVMYGAEATAMQYVDVPLGGDHSPIKDLSTPPDENTDYSQTEYHNTYEWNPDYEGNLIYPFSNPEPILLEHTLMGDNFPIVDYDYDSAKGVTTDAEAKEKLNGYLGSFTGDTTIALCVTEQEHTADELQANAGTAAELEPESSSLTERSASPNGDWASETNDGDMGAAGMDTSDGDQHDYSEFDIDYNANLASWKGSLPQGLATIVTGKNKISILISVPILSKTVGKDKKTFPKTITDPLSLSTGELAGVYDKLKNGSYDKLLEQWEKAGYKDSKSGKSIECMKTTFSLSFAMTFNIKYDTNTNNWYFQEFAAGITGAVSFKYTVRLAACPFIYAYISINAKLTVGSGGTISHNVVEGKTPLVPEGQDHDLNKNEALVVSTDYVNLNIRFKGKVYIEVLDSKDGTTTTAGTRTGYINSDGGNKIQVQLKNKSDGLKFDSTKYVRIVGLTDSTRIYYMNTVEDVTSKLLWSGVSINPTVNLEIGVGAGVELAKLEAFIKINVSANFILGKQMDDGSLKGAMVDSASFSLGVAIRATFLMFTFEMDAVAIKGSYTYSTDKWKWAYTV